MRFTSGPPHRHYCVPPLERTKLGHVAEPVQNEKHFMLHAHCQTGKTSILLVLQDLLNENGDYRCVYVNFEAGQAGREDTGRSMRTILEAGHAGQAHAVRRLPRRDLARHTGACD